MKQLASLLLLFFFGFLLYFGWSIYLDKNYKSKYAIQKKAKSIEIEALTLDTEKIQRLSKNIKGLKQDPVFRLKLNNFTTIQGQPLFKEKYGSVYDKIVRQTQKTNKR